MTFIAIGKYEMMPCFDPNIKLTLNLNPVKFLDTNTNNTSDVNKLSIYWKSAGLLSP